jgi:hypothetical protein
VIAGIGRDGERLTAAVINSHWSRRSDRTTSVSGSTQQHETREPKTIPTVPWNHENKEGRRMGRGPVYERAAHV